MAWDKKVDDVKVSKTYGDHSSPKQGPGHTRNDVTTIKLGISLNYYEEICRTCLLNLTYFLHNLQISWG